MRKLAAGFHRRTKAEPPAPLPREALAEPEEADPDLTEPVSAPPPAEPEKPKAEPPVRVVKHFPRWYDEAEHPRFSDMKF